MLGDVMFKMNTYQQENLKECIRRGIIKDIHRRGIITETHFRQMMDSRCYHA